VSVLFADLVAFTSASERRDAEDTREFLSRYFDLCRRLIELYGGTVEKFIGDAVVAIWGAPVATEDDPERAVRAALELVTAVQALGEKAGDLELRARAGVLSGEAAVTLGGSAEAMVAGDLINTASRVQAVAPASAVLVGEGTRRATEQAVVYESAGSFELKGKEGETPLWRAVRVVSGARGQLRSEGLEAPFVGRDGELRQIKELFHVCAEEHRAQLVSVTGIAGIGKSRLGWEFYKYIDGVSQTIYWHRGRCLAYGEGVTYWALGDMVRMRCRIAEDEEPEAALRKLNGTLEEHVLDPREREFVGPRLAQLLGLGEQEPRERQDLFGAWRVFFERLAETYPTVLAFEDMQWADAALLDFIEHLLEWSRGYPLFVLTLARPELSERRPSWGAGQRHFAAMYLESLSHGAMEELLAGLVPGLPAPLHAQILARAEGVPLYAVETVRMLLDRGLLVREGAVYRVAGGVSTLEVPETLHALIAARLDGLSAEERRVVQDAAVLGKTFALAALAALSGLERAALEGLLRGLVRREVLAVQSDPRSPEHGQYGFLQDLLRHVAYDTLSRRDRRAKHVAAAEYLAATLGEEEVAEVVASHLVDAYWLDPDAADAAPLRARARAALLRAGERAASLGAPAEAGRYFKQAGELAVEPAEKAAALLRAGQMALAAGANEQAGSLFDRTTELYETDGDTHAAARASGWRGLADVHVGRTQQAIERMEHAYAVIAGDEPDADLAFLLAQLGIAHWLAGDPERAAERTERALDLGEALQLPEVLCRAWMTKANVIKTRHPEEARALHQLALDTALAHDLFGRACAACLNLSDLGFSRNRYQGSLAHLEQSLDLARRIGDRWLEWFALSEMSYALTMLGRWEDALARLADIPDEQLGAQASTSSLSGVLEIYLHRDQLDRARALLARYEEVGRSDEVQAQGAYQVASAAIRLAEGDPRGALEAAEQVIARRAHVVGIVSQDAQHAFAHALEAALALGERAKTEELLAMVEDLPVGRRPPLLAATTLRFRARLAAEAPSAERDFAAAAGELRELELPFHLAIVLLEHGEWLVRQGRADQGQPLLDEARNTFERLEANPYLQRLDALQASQPAEIPA
jgi:predicted ATPase/class 3 adenylate cyclase